MPKKNISLTAFLLLIFLIACTFLFFYIIRDAPSKEIDEKVIHLINETTLSPTKQQAALLALEELGDVAVPYIISHLNDTRPLAAREMRTVNNFPGAMEHYAFHTPALVHDALSILLIQMTGKAYMFSDESSTGWQRKINTMQWIGWCLSHQSSKASLCTKGL